MTERSRLREVKLTLPMAPDMEVVASQAASSLATFIGMSPDRVDEVRLAVVECCINAFEHSRSAERKVDITFGLLGGSEPDTLEIRVHDDVPSVPSGGPARRTIRATFPKSSPKSSARRRRPRGWRCCR